MSEKATKPAETQGDGGADTPTRGRPAIDLSTPTGVLDELARLYRDARWGRLKVERASKLAYLLQSLLKAHQVVVLERRVAALEGDDGIELDDPNPDV